MSATRVATLVGKMDELIAGQRELIAATRAAAIPLRDRWLSAASIGLLLERSPSHVLTKLACLPDFPKPLRDGQPRWNAGEVQEWLMEYRRREVRARGKRT